MKCIECNDWSEKLYEKLSTVDIDMKVYYKVTDGYMSVIFEDIKRAFKFIEVLEDQSRIYLKIKPVRMTEEQYNALPI